MALTAVQAQGLKKLGLDQFLATNRADYKAMAKDAYEFTAKTLKASGLPVRQEDVSGHLQAAVELDAALTAFLETKRAGQQYWPKRFTYLIVEDVWKELQDEYAQEHPQG